MTTYAEALAHLQQARQALAQERVPPDHLESLATHAQWALTEGQAVLRRAQGALGVLGQSLRQ